MCFLLKPTSNCNISALNYKRNFQQALFNDLCVVPKNSRRIQAYQIKSNLYQRINTFFFKAHALH